MLSLCSLRSHNTTRVRLAARSRFARSRFARLLCSLRLPPRSPLLTSALSLRSRLPPRLLALLALPTARFARPAFPAARSAHCLSCCPPSLRSGRFSCLLAPLAASPVVLSLRSSARLLLAPLAASTATRFALCSPLAALPAARSSLAVYLIDLLARLTRLARFACSSISPHSTGRAGFAELTRQKSSERDGQKMSAIQRVESDPEIPDPSRACLVFQRSIVPPRAACACASRSAGGL